MNDDKPLFFLPNQNYECTMCGRCCRHWNVAVDPVCHSKLKNTALVRELEESYHQSAFSKAQSGQLITSRHKGACIFLDDCNRCMIHGRMGAEAKPLGCRLYPFLPRETPDGIFVGVSFFCSSIRENSGKPLAEHMAAIPLPPAKGSPSESKLCLSDTITISWQEYLFLENHLAQLLSLDQPWPELNSTVWKLCVIASSKISLQALEQDLIPSRPPGFERLIQFVLCGLISRIETEPAHTTPLLNQLFDDQNVRLPTSGWTGNITEMLYKSEHEAPQWLQDETRRYLKALLFRKFLLEKAPILENVGIMMLLPRILYLYTFIYNEMCSRSTPLEDKVLNLPHYYHALEICETILVTHGSDAYLMSKDLIHWIQRLNPTA